MSPPEPLKIGDVVLADDGRLYLATPDWTSPSSLLLIGEDGEDADFGLTWTIIPHPAPYADRIMAALKARQVGLTACVSLSKALGNVEERDLYAEDLAHLDALAARLHNLFDQKDA